MPSFKLWLVSFWTSEQFTGLEVENTTPDMSRVKEATPFSTVVDFAGPLFVRKEGKQMEKVYIVLYTCSVTRTVHLDLVKDKSAPVFLRSFRKFVARRGTPASVVSDNAKTFKASAKFLRKLYSDPQVRNYFDTSRIRWKFNLDRSPWGMGFLNDCWEA